MSKKVVNMANKKKNVLKPKTKIKILKYLFV